MKRARVKATFISRWCVCLWPCVTIYILWKCLWWYLNPISDPIPHPFFPELSPFRYTLLLQGQISDTHCVRDCKSKTSLSEPLVTKLSIWCACPQPARAERSLTHAVRVKRGLKKSWSLQRCLRVGKLETLAEVFVFLLWSDVLEKVYMGWIEEALESPWVLTRNLWWGFWKSLSGTKSTGYLSFCSECFLGELRKPIESL
jgi:hypothetical protein